jgi:hypothetical protein
MESFFPRVRLAFTLSFIACICIGCAAHKSGECFCAPSGSGFGYYSTCWRPWPAECPPCPSFAILGTPREEILSDRPLHQEVLAPIENAPLPPPATGNELKNDGDFQ